ncbi:MAG: thioredoxin domain-containing protein [Gemmataceae bacterium]
MTATQNRLASETSLYLRQHAANPVDWYPWGPEALERAKQLDRPIFLSIGYSACHWCHVMEHESFENAAVAREMNDRFVCIKVDREERPDLDDIYMKAVQLLNQGQGGWPMSVWLTPEVKPFFAGTYFPPDDRYGRPGFRRILGLIAKAWEERRDELVNSANEITRHLHDFGAFPPAQGDIDADQLLRSAADSLAGAFDRVNGGFGDAPKFPHALELRLLLRLWHRYGEEYDLNMVTATLDKMARGGIYDQIGGGFHRYSVDSRWLVPHFEKMLYDNALLAVTYLEAFQGTGNAFYRQIVEETLDYVLREMTSPGGAFYSTQDADSEGEEGKFYVWSKEEFDSALGAESAKLLAKIWDVSPAGNFEGHNILHRFRDDAGDAERAGMSVEEFRRKLAEAKTKLLALRSQRIWPGRDEKILTSWNGLMIAAFARAGAVLDRQDYTDAAVAAAEFLLRHVRTAEGRLYHTASAEGQAKLAGYLEDYAYLAEALTHLYEATFDPRWLREAASLCDVMLKHFADPAGGFFTTADDHEALLLRSKDQHDGSTPSGNAMTVTALLRLTKFLGREDFRAAATKTLTTFAGVMAAHPSAAGQMLIALDFAFGPVQEVALVGDRSTPEFGRVQRAARQSFGPRRIIAAGEADGIPLLADRPAKGAVTLYLCENFACQEPATDPLAAENMLRMTAVTR